VRFYVDNGGVGLERRLQAGCDRMLDILQRKGWVLGEDLVWFQDLQAEHNEAAWAMRVWRPLTFMFGIGEQAWIRTLPPPPTPIYAARDMDPVSMVDRPSLVVAGITGECSIHEGVERASALLRDSFPLLAEYLIASGTEYVVLLDGPQSRFSVLVGVTVPDTTARTGMTVRSLPPTWCRSVMHAGGLDTLSDTMDYLYTWWLSGTNLEIDGPTVVRLGRDPWSASTLEITIPIRSAD
jgi:predicted transcriptional regulator YdeE